jgi:uncharacterized protein (DUF1800 family)
MLVDRREWLAMAVAGLAGGGCANSPGGSKLPEASPPGLHDAQLLNRLSWGLSDSLVREAQQQGVAPWLEAQLKPHWPPTVPAQVQAQMDGYTVVRTPLLALARQMEAQRKAAEALTGDARTMARDAWSKDMTALSREATARMTLRAVHAREQLQDQIGWFWLNHFSVYDSKPPLRMLVADFDEALRPHALGRFRDLLGVAVFHPAMLHYLDNDKNGLGHINENLGRELLELHTLGVEGGYTQADVQALAAVLSGLGTSYAEAPPKLKAGQEALYVRRGLVEFNPARHDFSAKRLLGEPVVGAGMAEIEGVLDRLARHPATARHISQKLASFLLGNPPSAALEQKMSARFLASDGRIGEVLRVLIDAPEFRDSLNRRFKDPVHYVFSALRASFDGGRPLVDPKPVFTWLNRLGQAPFGRPTPDGYAPQPSAWNGSGQLTARFDTAKALVASGAAMFQGPANPRGAAFERFWGPGLSSATRQVLAEATSPREADVLWLSSPEFMWC